MASKTARRVRKDMGRATGVVAASVGTPPGPEPLVPNFSGDQAGEPRCAAIAEGGIRTAGDMIRFNGVMITDVLRKRLPAKDAQAINRANGLSLRAAELQAHYGRQVGPDGATEFVIDDSVPARAALAS